MPQKPQIAWAELDFAGFARLAGDARLSKYEKIGFPDAYRQGLEPAIFADICSKLPRLAERGRQVLDIGPGCSDLPAMMIGLCDTQGHQLHLVDSAEMLAQLPDKPFVQKYVGMFPQCRDRLDVLHGRVDVILCYSVLHYVFVDADVDEFIDTIVELLAPGGEALIGDIPNGSKRQRFFTSDAGIAFHRAFTGTDTLPPSDENTSANRIDDAAIIGLLQRARAAGADAYWLPQPASLPMANRREDILIRRP